MTVKVLKTLIFLWRIQALYPKLCSTVRFLVLLLPHRRRRSPPAGTVCAHFGTEFLIVSAAYDRETVVGLVKSNSALKIRSMHWWLPSNGMDQATADFQCCLRRFPWAGIRWRRVNLCPRISSTRIGSLWILAVLWNGVRVRFLLQLQRQRTFLTKTVQSID